jgi:HPt (histidine-containing phosphotransfer) domain-containing protein
MIDLPIIAMTAHAMRGDEEKCMAAGMDGYVPKPVVQSRLFQLLWRLLKNRCPVPEAKPLTFESETEAEVSGLNGGVLPDKVPGINIREALESLNLNPEIYRSILSSFRKNSLDIVQSICKAIEEKDTEQIVALAHMLKGSSGNIGARDLEYAAKELEAAVLKNSDWSLLKPPAKMVEEALNIVLNSISGLEGTGDVQPIKDSSASTLDNGRFVKMLNELAEALRRADPEEINRIHSCLKGSALWKKNSELDRLIEQYHYHEALEILTTLVFKF